MSRGVLLVPRDLPRDVEVSLQLAPVPWELRDLPPPALTHDAYGVLPADARAQREADFRSMPSGWSREAGTGRLAAYEALQPPLYYWIMAPVLRPVSTGSLESQVMILRPAHLPRPADRAGLRGGSRLDARVGSWA